MIREGNDSTQKDINQKALVSDAVIVFWYVYFLWANWTNYAKIGKLPYMFFVAIKWNKHGGEGSQ